MLELQLSKGDVMTSPEHHVGPWHVTYPEQLRTNVNNAAEAWEAFCELSEQTQNLFMATNFFDGVGFERKTGDGSAESHESHDFKLNFDINKTGLDELRSIATLIDGNEGRIAKRFIDCATTLVDSAQPALQEAGNHIATLANMPEFSTLAKDSAETATYRFLRYPKGAAVNSTIGESHADNSGFTLHLFEDTGGCEHLDEDKQTWHPMPVADGQATAFASMQTQEKTKGEVDALWHRIQANETTANFGRTAMVCFVALKDVAKYDRKTHGRLQTWEPGSTYGQDPEEFSKYFVKAA